MVIVNPLLALMLTLSIMLMPTTAFAQACPGNTHTVSMHLAKAIGPNGTATTMFVGTAGCTYTRVGATGMLKPLDCGNYISMGTKHIFRAGFYNTSWRVMAGTTGGCSFMCGPGNVNSCFVRGSDALPVELMEFNIEE